MVEKCIGCGKFMSSRSDGVTCPKCKSRCHYGCAQIPEGATVGGDWRCGECQAKTPKCRDPATPVRGLQNLLLGTASPAPEAMEHASSELSPTNKGSELVLNETAHNMTAEFSETDLLRTLKEEMLSEFIKMQHNFSSDMSSLRQELRDFMKEVRDLRQEVSEIRSSLSSCNERLDTFDKRMTAVEQASCERSTLDASETLTSSLEQTIDQLKIELNDRDQDFLLNDVEITGLPEQSVGNPMHIATVVGAKVGISLDERDIVFAERVGAPQRPLAENSSTSRPRRIVVRFSRRSIRNEFIRAARVRRVLTTSDIGQEGPPARIYINERLTKTNRQLFGQTREEAKLQGWKHCWTREGRILVRKDDGTSVSRVRNRGDIVKVFGTR